MGCPEEQQLISNVCEVLEKISALESLKPSKDVNMLFTQLVLMCVPPNPIDVSKLPKQEQEIGSKLIRLCGEAEGLLESHYSSILGSDENPLDHLNLFPYYSNYLKLSHLEFTILSQHCTNAPARIAFVGSGPLPLTSIVLAAKHLTSTVFHNFDIDPSANSMAANLVSSNPDLSKRMSFHTTDIMDVSATLKDYDVVFLAALVGMDKDEKNHIIHHLNKHMAPGAILMLRSAHGARAFLYPVVDPCELKGFEVLSVYHPTDEVINSVVIARKCPVPVNSLDQGLGHLMLPCKCAERSSKKKFAKKFLVILLLLGDRVYGMDTNDSGSGNRTLIEKHIRDSLFSLHHIAAVPESHPSTNGVAAAPRPAIFHTLAVVIIIALVVLLISLLCRHRLTRRAAVDLKCPRSV